MTPHQIIRKIAVNRLTGLYEIDGEKWIPRDGVTLDIDLIQAIGDFIFLWYE